ncbi:MAG: hypothetical protein KC456_08115 [Flavobacteriales bacterium]|nr:hypothetical protein [Flavobacteriales bacterium]
MRHIKYGSGNGIYPMQLEAVITLKSTRCSDPYRTKCILLNCKYRVLLKAIVHVDVERLNPFLGSSRKAQTADGDKHDHPLGNLDESTMMFRCTN